MDSFPVTSTRITRQIACNLVRRAFNRMPVNELRSRLSGVLTIGPTRRQAVSACGRPADVRAARCWAWSSGTIALGRRLMRLLPEDDFDNQPLCGQGGSVVLVADVRLDNRDELVRALNIFSTRARLLSDADVLLAALERWDEACLERLVGDYAFIRWDSARRQLLLARDPLGQRPLHYHHGTRFFAVASMPKGLHALPEVPYAPDQERTAEWLASVPRSGTKSYFSSVERVEPGHVVSVTPNGVRARRFWLPRRHAISLRGPLEYAEALRERLDDAVRCRLRGARDVAAHLSGGLDSSAVSATAARLLAPSGGRVVAFTAVPREGYDGSPPEAASLMKRRWRLPQRLFIRTWSMC